MTQRAADPLSTNFCVNLFLSILKLKVEGEIFVENWQLMKKIENSKWTSTDKKMLSVWYLDPFCFLLFYLA